MFDLISGGPRHPFHDKTSAPFLVSIAGHVVVVAALVVVPLLVGTSTLPVVPSMMAFVATAPAAPPPPPPSPPVRTPTAPRKMTALKPRDHPASALSAPLAVPRDIVPDPLELTPSDDGEGGVEGGLEGGVADGIVGGLLETAPSLPAPPPPSPPPAPKPNAPVRVGGVVRAPALLKRVEPVYPALAAAAQVNGIVILEAVVGRDGSVESVHVVRSVKLLDQAAIDAVTQWKYAPLELNGSATPFVLTVTIRFSL